MKTIFEKEIIRKFQKGDKSIFELLFKSYYTPLCSYAFTFVKNYDIAEEIVQETFIRIWESRERLDINTSVRAYFYKCVHNNCINFLKQNEVNTRHTQAMLKEITYHAELANLNYSESLLDTMVSEEMERYFETIINELPDECRKIFFLKRYEQLTNPEIADQLNISVNTVKTQLLRAFDKLQEGLRKFRKENF